MNKRVSLILVLALLVSGLLTACGGGAPAPVAFSSLPVFTGASESTNPTLTEILTTKIDQQKTTGQLQNIDGKMYEVPAGTTLDAVNSFYKDALGKAGWTVAQESS
jgi:hypothetical protein